MKEITLKKFHEEIQLFRKTLAPTVEQRTYLNKSKQSIEKEILETAGRSGTNPERCLLTAICGELTSTSTKQEQAQFATRLLLLDLLIETLYP